MTRVKTALAATLAVTLAGCNLAPKYETPVVAMPVAYKEVGDWSPAMPADAEMRGAWWAAFSDPILNDLEGRVESASPTLAAAVARYDQALAALGISEAALLPSVDGKASAARNRYSGQRPLAASTTPVTQNDYILGATASYELDLWGRIRNQVKESKANAQASDADLASVRLSLQATAATTYLRLRGLDAQIALYNATVDAFERALALTETRHNGGASSGIDVGRAQTQLSTARADRASLVADRAGAEHALAALVGEPASTFTLAAVPAQLTPLPIPVAAPSLLLQRRPDVAAAERRVAAANARIGIQRAAFFPTLSLNAGAGSESTGPNLLNAPATYWALGPAAAALSLFDGGRRSAGVAAARGAFEESAANYRGTVLNAIRDVEDQMSLVNQLATASLDQDAASVAAARTTKLALIQYNEGAANYLEVVTAQTAELQARRTALSIATRRLQADVDLVRALGGGWHSPQVAASQ